MAGGTWINENKVRPGAYINFKANNEFKGNIGERGIATLPLSLSWGQEKKVVEINNLEEITETLGIELNDDSALLIKEALKRAKTLLVYRVNSGEKSKATHGALKILGKYSGSMGNDLSIIIESNIDIENKFDVKTLFRGLEVDKQTIISYEELVSNKFVDFSLEELEGENESPAIEITAGVSLSGGTDGIPMASDYVDYFKEIELYSFNTIGIPVQDQEIKAVAVNFIKRLRDEEGRRIQLVIENYKEADYEGVISVKNGVILNNNIVIPSHKAVAWVTGAVAASNVNESLTYSKYDGAVDVDIKYNNKEIIQSLNDGEIIFTTVNSNVVIEQDINTLKTFEGDKSSEYRKNRVIRTLDEINNEVKNLWENNYIGKGNNNADGRNLFKKDLIKLLEAFQGLNAIENLVIEDITVELGSSKDSIIVKTAIQPVDSMEKLYMTVEVI